jgi:hypothetical protein
MTARTTITADTLQQAKAMLTRTFGDGNVLNINHVMAEDEKVTEATKTLSPQELQVKALADQAKRLSQQKKQLQARQAMAKAQEKMRDATKL